MFILIEKNLIIKKLLGEKLEKRSLLAMIKFNENNLKKLHLVVLENLKKAKCQNKLCLFKQDFSVKYISKI